MGRYKKPKVGFIKGMFADVQNDDLWWDDRTMFADAEERSTLRGYDISGASVYRWLSAPIVFIASMVYVWSNTHIYHDGEDRMFFILFAFVANYLFSELISVLRETYLDIRWHFRKK